LLVEQSIPLGFVGLGLLQPLHFIRASALPWHFCSLYFSFWGFLNLFLVDQPGLQQLVA